MENHFAISGTKTILWQLFDFDVSKKGHWILFKRKKKEQIYKEKNEEKYLKILH